MNIDLVNNTGSDIRSFEAAILASLSVDGSLPEALADLFVVSRVDGLNPDGSPRWILNAA